MGESRLRAPSAAAVPRQKHADPAPNTAAVLSPRPTNHTTPTPSVAPSAVIPGLPHFHALLPCAHQPRAPNPSPRKRQTSHDQAPGRIVNLGSYAGTIATPLFGAYAASKFALEAISDSLRYELRPWGIHTALIKAGGVKTPIWDKSIASSQGVVQQGVDPAAMAPYQGMSDEVGTRLGRIDAGVWGSGFLCS